MRFRGFGVFSITLMAASRRATVSSSEYVSSLLSERAMVGRFPASIDPALIHLTGTIVTWWGRIEGCLVYDLITLRNLPENADYAAKEPFPVVTGRIIKQWSRLQRAWSGNDADRLTKVTKMADDLHDAADDRNIVAHYFWPYGSSDPSKLRLQCVKPQRKTHDRLQFITCEIDVQKLDEINERLMALYHKVMVGTANLIIRTSNPGLPPIGDKVAVSAIGTLGHYPPTHE